jgi:hypothetical protein
MIGNQPAIIADRLHTAMLRRCWSPPDQKRERPAPGDTGSEAQNQTSEHFVSTIADLAAQRAYSVALRRAGEIDRLADILITAGLHLQGEALAHRAAEMREVLA